MITFIQAEVQNGTVIKALAGEETLFQILLPPSWSGKIRLVRNNRPRYLVEFDWASPEKYDALGHPELLSLPFRITDGLGLERGWIENVSDGGIVEKFRFVVDGETLSLNAFPYQHCWDMIDSVSMYRGEQVVAVIDGMGEGEVSNVRITQYTNDYAAELAVLATVYFLRRNDMI